MRFNSTEDQTASLSSSINDNGRIHPVANFNILFENTLPTSVSYDRKMPLQPDELLLYSLMNVVCSKNPTSLKAEEYANISKAIYFAFYSKSIQKIVASQESILLDLAEAECSDDRKYEDCEMLLKVNA